jgi:hypothetical protein
MSYAVDFFLSGRESPYAWSAAPGQLPPGLALQSADAPADNDNQLAGTPTKAGTTLRDQAAKQFSLTIGTWYTRGSTLGPRYRRQGGTGAMLSHRRKPTRACPQLPPSSGPAADRNRRAARRRGRAGARGPGAGDLPAGLSGVRLVPRREQAGVAGRDLPERRPVRSAPAPAAAVGGARPGAAGRAAPGPRGQRRRGAGRG